MITFISDADFVDWLIMLAAEHDGSLSVHLEESEIINFLKFVDLFEKKTRRNLFSDTLC